MHPSLVEINKTLTCARHRPACWTYAESTAKLSGSESSIPTNCSLSLPDSGKALFPWYPGHKWRNIIEMIICIKTQIWADISTALYNPRGCLGEGERGRRGGLPVSLGGMINEAGILGGPSPPPPRPRGQGPHIKLALHARLPQGDRATDDPLAQSKHSPSHQTGVLYWLYWSTPLTVWLLLQGRATHYTVDQHNHTCLTPHSCSPSSSIVIICSDRWKIFMYG